MAHANTVNNAPEDIAGLPGTSAMQPGVVMPRSGQ
jgi:hypothetical protein